MSHEPNQQAIEAAWPDGASRRRFLYFCPRCKIECRGPWHTCESGGLIPQAATETECTEVEVIPRAAEPHIRADERERVRKRIEKKIEEFWEAAQLRTLKILTSYETGVLAGLEAARDALEDPDA